MQIEVLTEAEAVAVAAARRIAQESRAAVGARGRFVIAFSGGRSPGQMFHALVAEDVPWDKVYVLQVDERIAPEGHPDRNLTVLRESLLSRVPLPESQLCAMPVDALDLELAAKRYQSVIERVTSQPPVIDLVHLGLGTDGHTASLVPGDPVLKVADADVALTGTYEGRRRMTLTYPMLNRAREVLWVVTGGAKRGAFERLRRGDETIPAGRICRDRARVLADWAAAGMSG